MLVKEAEFIKSSSDIKQCPESPLPEYAFIGRSNVGKSSLINMLTGRKKLAKISAKPGKTQLINHFLINKQWHLVDLPGYGWAKVSKSKRADWGDMIQNYLLKRAQLLCLFILIDSRIPPQEIDLSFIAWVGTKQIPFVLVFTKVDKQSINKTQKSIAAFRRALKEEWAELPLMFVTSSTDNTGKDEILEYIDSIRNVV
ncbi:ribosome biogenesis GTP-binding protein YihA/YsxC [Catalinimonas niigatensis]|uniref:ribosome biogenesis GTP-binding protein YihA/YsxC n=1 Tax=Catalinimonas niigatensis TaxID=1397264 RepID=UPI00266645A2|nr:ribosome biogenesis GTP-binding protein YihA/YsxC [Catalinimonas niigatensis]WPP49412.1 ribosome biogenesis GTP-binding protein YihA/YsxC [Catalinimonas niigatensis]